MDCMQALGDRSRLSEADTVQGVAAWHAAAGASWAVPFDGACPAPVLDASVQNGSCMGLEHTQVQVLGCCWQPVVAAEREDGQDLIHRDCNHRHMHDTAEQVEGEVLLRGLSAALAVHLAMVRSHRSELARVIGSQGA